MPKLKTTLLFGLALLIASPAIAQNSTPSTVPTIILLKRKKKEDHTNPPTTRPGKLIPGAPAPIDAWVIAGDLSLTFLTDLGEAEITVASDFSAWSVTEHFDTADGAIIIPVASDPGSYTITVETPTASYAGAYEL